MKIQKFLLSVLCLLSSVLCSAQDLRTVLATSTANGVTKTTYVGRIQADPGKDGTITITVFPAVVFCDSAGNVLSETLDTSHTFPLVINPTVKATLAALVQAAYLAANPPGP